MASAANTKEGDVLDDIERAAFLPLSQEGKTAMKSLLNRRLLSTVYTTLTFGARSKSTSWWHARLEWKGDVRAG